MALIVILGVGMTHVLMKIMFNDDMYIDTCKHGKRAISQCPKCNFGYDFQEDIANYGNGEYDYDYDKDCNISSKYEYDLGAENELSQEYESNHTDEDKN